MGARNPKLEEFLPYAKARGKSEIVKTLLNIGAFVFCGIILLMLSIVRQLYPAAALASIPIMMIGASFLYSLWWRIKILRIDNRARLADASGDPVLLLRPFYDNPPKLPLFFMPFTDSAREYRNIFRGKTPENFTASALRDLGPVISVGRPGEELPPYGPIILYFGDNEWQEKVEKLISVSKLVVVQAGVATGLEWEMRTVKDLMRPDQVIVSLRTWKRLERTLRDNNYDVFATRAEEIFGVKFPKAISGGEYMRFDPNWQPQFVRRDFLKDIARRSRNAAEPVVRSAHDFRSRLPEAELARWLVPVAPSPNFRETITQNPLWTQYVSNYKYWWSIGILLPVCIALFVIAYLLLKPNQTLPESRGSTARSLFESAKWTKFRPTDTAFIINLPGEPKKLDQCNLPLMFKANRLECFGLQYPWYHMGIIVERYVLEKEVSSYAAINDSTLRGYKNEYVKSLSLGSRRESDGVLYLKGEIQQATVLPNQGYMRGPDSTFEFTSAVAAKHREAIVIMVYFIADNVAAAEDARKNAQKITESISF